MTDEREPPEHPVPDECSPQRVDVVVNGVVDVERGWRLTAPHEVDGNHAMMGSE